MPRPQRKRRVCCEPKYEIFIPKSQSVKEKEVLTVDEYETIRWIDYHKKTHEQCAHIMDISRTTVTEIYEAAREKIADCLINGKELRISGGNYQLCNGGANSYCSIHCKKTHQPVPGKMVQSESIVLKEGEKMMKVAVTYENGEIFQHFGHTAQFKIYEIENGTILKDYILDANGSGHGALAELLATNQVNVLICGGIGGGAQTALKEAGIQLFGGVSDNADEAVQALLTNQLVYNPDVMCSHHHGEEHTCGADKHGCGGN